MGRRPNYGQERAERARRKAARRDERLASKAERRDKNRPAGEENAVALEPALRTEAAERSAATLPIGDTTAMGRLGQALSFVCGADHPTTLAVQRAAASGGAEDVARARTLFLRLPPRDQHAALRIAAAPASTP